MTDNEIIKALECCQTNDETKCVECPYCNDCIEQNNVVTDTLDLINRQKAEIERLKVCNYKLQKTFTVNFDKDDLERIISKQFKAYRADFINEFAERLKKKTYPFPCAIGVENAVTLRAINELVEEMVGDKNA